MIHTLNEIQVSYRENPHDLTAPMLTCSKKSADLLYTLWDQDTIALQECFKIVLLNNSNMVKCIHPLSMGGITGTLVDLRILFAVVLKTLSVGIILAHNHPSGTLKPSEADKALTSKIQKIAEFHDIRVLDHIILVPGGAYYSFADNGLL
jgi:DNA repair protein RadC